MQVVEILYLREPTCPAAHQPHHQSDHLYRFPRRRPARPPVAAQSDNPLQTYQRLTSSTQCTRVDFRLYCI